MIGSHAHQAIADLSGGAFLPVMVVCPGCAGRELVGHGDTEWVCHDRTVTVTVATPMAAAPR